MVEGPERFVRPLTAVAAEALRPAPDPRVPTHPSLPVLLLRAVFTPEADSRAICASFERGGWGGTWTYTVFDFPHFHPNAHEVLAVAKGWGEVRLGGPAGPVVRLDRGDAIILPSGTVHCRIAASPDFAVCGAYPPGQHGFETMRAAEEPPTEALKARIAAVPLPPSDPIYGQDGPLMRAWTIDT